MNIGILIPELGGGGAERVAQIFGNYYIARGHNVYYFIANTKIKQDYPVKGQIIQTNIKSCTDGNYSDIERLMKLFLASFKIRKLKMRYKIDVAVSFMEEFSYLNVLSKGKETVIAVMCTVLSKREEFNGFLYKKRIVRFFYSKADKTVVLTQYALNDMHFRYGIPLKKLIKLPTPVADLEIKDNENAWSFGSKAVVCVGRLELVKQHERIIRAFSYVCQWEIDARLIILGKGPRLKSLRNLCEKLHIENHVVFAGFTENVPFYLQNARVFVMASKVEGFPNSMIEAMHYGVPVITTDSFGGCSEIVKKPKGMGYVNSVVFCKYGILTPNMPSGKFRINSKISEEEVILGEAMRKVITEDNIYEKYRRQSLKRAEMFRVEKVMERWNNIIKEGQ